MFLYESQDLSMFFQIQSLKLIGLVFPEENVLTRREPIVLLEGLTRFAYFWYVFSGITSLISFRMVALAKMNPNIAIHREIFWKNI